MQASKRGKGSEHWRCMMGMDTNRFSARSIVVIMERFAEQSFVLVDV